MLTLLSVPFAVVVAWPCRSVANCLSEVDQLQGDDLMDDVEMASIAEEEDFIEMFSNQGTSTVSGRRKIVSLPRNGVSDLI